MFGSCLATNVSSTRDEYTGTGRYIKQLSSSPLPSSSIPTSPFMSTLDLKPISARYSFVPSHEISPGIFSDQSVSSRHPDVQDLLKVARSQSYLNGNFNPIVYALAALDLLYKPCEQAHWLFWSSRKMQKTAEIVNSVYFHNPPLIQSKVTWVGVRESLNFLRNYRASWKTSYEAAPWFHIHEPQEQPPPRMQLRERNKRKRVQTYDFLSDHDLDQRNPMQSPAKRPRTRRTVAPRKVVSRPVPVYRPFPELHIAERQVSPASTSIPSPGPSSPLSEPPRTPTPEVEERLNPYSPPDSILSETTIAVDEPGPSRPRSSSRSSADTAVSTTGVCLTTTRTRPRSISISSALTAVASSVDGKSDCGDVSPEDFVVEDEGEQQALEEPKELTKSGPVRRRSRRAAAQTSARPDAPKTCDLNTADTDMPVKRKRGRPRKNAT
ncbi:hypothetical protein BDV98DRAFT_562900 [Pterulicium gracile]|uniref:Uncharacterized protein n=1 Tax=Pterulicium gracile TaxID=1884261 RepID=A0A5C3QVK9_9AGAR|nr:hypothetical protein BDV98DRAFT_562900 [Pterula gracilis]